MVGRKHIGRTADAHIKIIMVIDIRRIGLDDHGSVVSDEVMCFRLAEREKRDKTENGKSDNAFHDEVFIRFIMADVISRYTKYLQPETLTY